MPADDHDRDIDTRDIRSVTELPVVVAAPTIDVRADQAADPVAANLDVGERVAAHYEDGTVRRRVTSGAKAPLGAVAPAIRRS